MLQWGRRLSAAESAVYPDGSWTAYWLQWGRRLSAAESWARPARGTCSRFSFNGAAAFQRRRGCFTPGSRPKGISLQWGRRLSAAKRDRALYARLLKLSASMGPPPFSGGERRRDAVACSQASASMGPPPFSGGEEIWVDAVAWSDESLQWGRRLSAAEIGLPGLPEISCTYNPVCERSPPPPPLRPPGAVPARLRPSRNPSSFKHLPALRAPPGFFASLHRSQPLLPPSFTTPPPPLAQPLRSPRPLCRSLPHFRRSPPRLQRRFPRLAAPDPSLASPRPHLVRRIPHLAGLVPRLARLTPHLDRLIPRGALAFRPGGAPRRPGGSRPPPRAPHLPLQGFFPPTAGALPSDPRRPSRGPGPPSPGHGITPAEHTLDALDVSTALCLLVSHTPGGGLWPSSR
ncbi:hypothetical protein NQZ70_00509 [Sorangium sp. Soce836]|nr:hypothetical protein NQZ70_00509 [Sorangium sp. Soce836]